MPDRLPLLLFAVAASFATAVAVSLAPDLTLKGGIAVAALLLFARGRSHIPKLPRFDLARGAIPDSDDGAYGTPRMLMYAGLVASCWLQLRAFGITLSDALFLLAFICAACEAVVRGDDRVVISETLWIGVGLFVVGGIVSTLWDSANPGSSYGIVLRVFYLVAAWFWTGAKAFRTREHLWMALKMWVISAAVCGYWTLGQKYGGLPGAVDFGRFAGLSEHVNDLGALASCAIVPALVLVRQDQRWAIAGLGIIGGLLLSQSVGGAAAAVAALLFGLMAPDLTRATLIALAVGAVGILIASPIVGSTAITRFATTTNASAGSGRDTFNTRIRTYQLAFKRVERDPLLGTGLDVPSSSVYDAQTHTSFQVHNLFLGTWLEAGILGLAGIIVLECALLADAWRQVKSGHDRLLALVLLSGMIAYLVNEMGEPSLYKRYSLVPALLVVALTYQARERAAAVDRAGTPWMMADVGYMGRTISSG